MTLALPDPLDGRGRHRPTSPHPSDVTRVSDGLVREQLGYTKTPGGLPLPD